MEHPPEPLRPNAFDKIGELRAARDQAGHIFVGLDFDGTLAPIVPRPADAVLMEGTAPVLAQLATRPDTTIAIISGRGVADARERVGLPIIHYAGNHGMEISGPGFSWIHPDALAARPALDFLLAELQHDLGDSPEVIMEDKLVSLSVHYRMVQDAAAEERIQRIVENAVLRTGGPLRMTAGKKVVEIRPDVDWDKGSALAFLRERLELAAVPALFIGDDTTDEDAFRELRNGQDLSIIVGAARTRPTRATAYLATIPDVLAFLAGLAE